MLCTYFIRRKNLFCPYLENFVTAPNKMLSSSSKIKPLWSQTPVPSSRTSTVTALPGFEVLNDCCQQLFTVNVTSTNFKQQQQDVQINLPQLKLKWQQYFKIFNSNGEHILSAAEVKNECPAWDFCIFVLRIDGEVLFSIARRHEVLCAGIGKRKRRQGDRRQDWKSYKKADKYLRTQVKFIRSSDEESGKISHIHVCLPGGTFLGHIWIGNDDDVFLIHDIEYYPMLSIEKSAYKENTSSFRPHHLLQGKDRLSEVPSIISANNTNKVAPLENQQDITSNKLNCNSYDLIVEGAKVGTLQFNINPQDLKISEIQRSGSANCCCATFSTDFEEEEKALVLSFLLYKQRMKHSVASKCIRFIFSGTALALFISVLMIVILLIILWRFDFLD